MMFEERGDLITCFIVGELGEGDIKERGVLSHIRPTIT